jgi:hypothetical protein
MMIAPAEESPYFGHAVRRRIRVDRCVVLVSFEGPDWYAWRGGLAGRVASLAAEFTARGWLVHHVYLGDPRSPGTESLGQGRLVLHRWAQWLSAHHPAGVYDGEEAKLEELARSLPAFVIELIRPIMQAQGEVTVLAEEWQTAPFLLALADALRGAALGPGVRLLWRTGSMFGWERVDWHRLATVATIAATDTDLCRALEPRGIRAGLLPADPRAALATLAPSSPPPRMLAADVPAARRRTRNVRGS